MTQDKKTAIYEAVLSLINEKHEMASIKVADIAERANIGKGTVYEYFESKEQIVAQSFIYTAEKALMALKENITANLSFKESYIMMLMQIGSMMKENKSILKYITLSENSFSIHQKVQSLVEKEFEEIRKDYMSVYEEIVDKSVAEGIIKKKPPTYDWYIAIINSIMCLMIQNQGFEEFKEITPEKALEKAYEMYIKMLS